MKEIPLHNNEGDVIAYALVDNEDYDFLMQWRWFTSTGYAARSGSYLGNADGSKRRKNILMHDVINNPPESYFTDHQDRNRLNNQRSNLRTTTWSGNQQNREKLKGHFTSKFKGVSWDKDSLKWRTKIGINGKSKHIGFFINELDAARAYDEAARIHHGEFARTNF